MTDVLERHVERTGDVLLLQLERGPDVDDAPDPALLDLLDRSGRPADALAVLDDLDPTQGREIGSPRLRYSNMPTAALVAARRSLNDEVDRRLPLLGRAIAGDDPSATPAGTE